MNVTPELLQRAGRCPFCRAPARTRCTPRGGGAPLPYLHLDRVRASRLAGDAPRRHAGTTPAEDWSVRLMAGCTTADYEARQEARRVERESSKAGRGGRR